MKLLKLRPQEKRIVRLLAEKALCNKDIARVMGLTYNTVRVYMGSVFAKVGVRSRLELVAWALENPEALA